MNYPPVQKTITSCGQNIKAFKTGSYTDLKYVTKKGVPYKGQGAIAYVSAQLFGCSLVNLADQFYNVRVLEGRSVEVEVVGWTDKEFRVSYGGHKYYVPFHCVTITDADNAEAIAHLLNT